MYADKDYLNTYNDNIINYFKNIGISVTDVNSNFTFSGKNWEGEKLRGRKKIVISHSSNKGEFKYKK